MKSKYKWLFILFVSVFLGVAATGNALAYRVYYHSGYYHHGYYHPYYAHGHYYYNGHYYRYTYNGGYYNYYYNGGYYAGCRTIAAHWNHGIWVGAHTYCW